MLTTHFYLSSFFIIHYIKIISCILTFDLLFYTPKTLNIKAITKKKRKTKKNLNHIEPHYTHQHLYFHESIDLKKVEKKLVKEIDLE